MAVPSAFPKRARNHPPKALIWPPLKICKRGPVGEGPKNTFPVLDSALCEGAEGIAIEVQLSRDGVPVVRCDPRFSRRVPSPAHVRLLSEVFQWLRNEKCTAYVALSNSTPGAEAKVLKEISRAKVRHLTRVIANNLPGLRRLRRLDSKVYLGLRFSGRPPALRQVKDLGAEVLLPRWTAVLPSFIRRAHRASLLIIPWTVDSPRQMRRTILEGADGVITSYPAKLSETVARLQKTMRAEAP